MTATLSIQSAQQLSLKQRAKISIGRIAAHASPHRTRQLMESPSSSPRSVRDKTIMEYLKYQARVQKRDDFFEALHNDFWQGDGGAVFAENCDHRFEELFLGRQSDDFHQLQLICQQRRPLHIVEFGCNSGVVLNYMVKNLPSIQTAVGIDINRLQIQRNLKANHFDPRIEFLAADGVQWVLDNATKDTLFVTNGGVMEYFRRSRLNEMLTHIADRLSPAIFFAIEPNAPDHDLENNHDSIPFGEELSFSHNYKHLFQSNGFDIRHQRFTEYQTWKMMATIAVA
jgi:SAM-dependent methyltransferase